MSSPIPVNHRIEWIDAAKGFCIFAVVIYHFNLDIYHVLPTGETLIPQAWQVLISALKPLRMPLFFMISGYLASRAIFGRCWAQARTSKIASLLWVYALWFSIYWIAENYILPPNPLYAFGSDEPATLLGMMNSLLTADSGLWYLYALVLYFIIAKLLHGSTLVTLMVGFALAQAVVGLSDDQWNLANLARYFIFFAIGAHYNALITRYFSSFNARLFLIIAVLTIVAMGLARIFYTYYVGVWHTLMGILMCVTAAQAFAWLCQLFNMKLLREVGRQTLPIYVMHMLFISALAPIFPVLHNQIILLLEPVVIPTAIVAGCLMLYRTINRRIGRAMFTMPHTFRRVAYRTGLLQPVH